LALNKDKVTEIGMGDLLRASYKMIELKTLMNEPTKPTEEELFEWLMFKDGFYHKKILEVLDSWI